MRDCRENEKHCCVVSNSARRTLSFGRSSPSVHREKPETGLVCTGSVGDPAGHRGPSPPRGKDISQGSTSLSADLQQVVTSCVLHLVFVVHLQTQCNHLTAH